MNKFFAPGGIKRTKTDVNLWNKKNIMKTPISYYGGKQKMMRHILPMIPKHKIYVEPFLGGGAVFFAKPKSKHEVLNDIDGRITNFFRICQTKYDELAMLIKGTAHSEIEHKRAKDLLKNMNGTDVELAWAFWVQTNMSFEKQMFGGFTFGKSCRQPLNTANKRDSFTEKYAERLRDVTIFSRDALDVIRRMDSEETFFYCDPPYVSADQGHYKGYTMEDFSALLETLSNIKGKFLLSNYPEQTLLDFVSKHKWNRKQITCSVRVTGRRKEKKIKIECLTWNYNANDLFYESILEEQCHIAAS